MQTKFMLALAAIVTFGTSAFAGPAYQPLPSKVRPRILTAPVAEMKCDTMAINGGGRQGTQVVPCKSYAKIRPTECRIACRIK